MPVPFKTQNDENWDVKIEVNKRLRAPNSSNQKNIKKKWTHEEIALLKENSHLRDFDLSTMLNRSVISIRGKRRQIGLIKKENPKYSINMNFFKRWSNSMAYILGYVYADGSIRIRNSGSEVTIKSKDKSILSKMNFLMESSYPIHKELRTKNYIYVLSISRKALVKDLVSLGLTPKKSFTMKFPTVPSEFFFHFVRGYFDGDGHVRILYKSLEISFTSGSSEFLNKLQSRLDENNIVSKIYQQSNGNYFILKILNVSREEAYIAFYKDANIYLERKKKVFDEFFSKFHIKTIQCVDCNKRVVKTGNNQKRCQECKNINQRRLNRISYKKRKNYLRK